MAYATIEQVELGFRALETAEYDKCSTLLDEAAVIIDAYNKSASADAKMVVSCRMVRRALGEANAQLVPMGASQGSASAGGYSQSWTIGSGGSIGELYLNKIDKNLLGTGNRACTISPLEGMVTAYDQRN